MAFSSSIFSYPSAGQSGSYMIPGMQDIYSQTLGLNESNYQNILNTYAQGQSNLTSQLGSITGGYDTLLGGIKSTLGIGGGGWGVAAPAAEAIRQSFEATEGKTDQALINAGLGNTTVRGNLQNQNSLFAGQAYGGLGAQLASTYAGYQGQIGTAKLGAQMQGLGMQTNLYGQQGSTLGGYRFANTAGNLTGGFSNSGYGGGGFNTMPSGGGGGGGRMSGGPSGRMGLDPYGRQPDSGLVSGGSNSTAGGFGGYGGSATAPYVDPYASDYYGGQDPYGIDPMGAYGGFGGGVDTSGAGDFSGMDSSGESGDF